MKRLRRARRLSNRLNFQEYNEIPIKTRRGEVDSIWKENECDIEWKIKDFNFLSEQVGTYFYSPPFTFEGESWKLGIYPNGKYNITKGFIDVCLDRLTSGPPVNVDFTFSLKTFEGEKDLERRRAEVFLGWDLHRVDKFISRTELHRRKLEFLANGVLSVICTLKKFKSTGSAIDDKATAECSHSKRSLYADNNLPPKKGNTEEEVQYLRSASMGADVKAMISPESSDVISVENWHDHETPRANTKADDRAAEDKKTSLHPDNISPPEKCTGGAIKSPEFPDVIDVEDLYDHKNLMTNMKVSEKLIQDLKTAMLNGDHSDITVKVEEEEFKLHKVLLAARNPYFYSMFKNDTKEKSIDVVTVEDIKPDIFRSFIHFLYAGEVDKLSQENVCDLYKAADKYQEEQLKQICLHSMLNTLSVDNFCDYFALSLSYDEKELFQKALEFFVPKGKEIARSVKWQTLVKEYPIQANELFIKSLDHYVT